MKALARRGGAPEDEDEADEVELAPTECGFAPNYEKPPTYPANENLITRTVEILIGQFQVSTYRLELK